MRLALPGAAHGARCAESRHVSAVSVYNRRMRFRVVSYNIHKCIGGVDRRYRPERIVDALAHYEPDIVLLQEVDDGVPRSRKHRQVDTIADGLGFRYRAFQSNVHLRIGKYGNATVSRFPIKAPKNVDLTIPLKKRRRALVVKMTLPTDRGTHTMWVANVHLGLAGFERRMQVRRLLESGPIRRVRSNTPLLVGGDFNETFQRLQRQIIEPAGLRPAARPLPTFPAAMPIQPLDRIYYRGPLRVESAFVGHTKLARQASDHRPLIADFVME